MSMETETRSTPDLSRERLAFLCATMKGASEIVASVAEKKKREKRRKETNRSLAIDADLMCGGKCYRVEKSRELKLGFLLTKYR